MDKKLLTTLLARQGIYNKDGSVYAYELLYRNPDAFNLQESSLFCGEEATTSVITQLFSSLEMNTIIGDKLAFINFTHNHLIRQTPSLLPKERIVVEVLENVVIDVPLINSLKLLKEKGYKIALDDFTFNEQTAFLIELADIIKIDVLHQSKAQIKAQLKHLHYFKGTLLAEKIEDSAQFARCIELGFDYFQGFFLNKPFPLKGKAILENKNNLLRLLAELNNEEITMERVEEIILQVPKLSYRLLRIANSAYFYRNKKIDSVMDALQKIGLNQIRNWLTLFLLSSNNELFPDLLERTLIRAKMCECLAEIAGDMNTHQAYTVGMLSTLDSFLNESMASLLGKIQLCELLNEAILHHRGKLGTLLQLTIDYEHANFNQLEQSPYNKEDLTSSYLEGIEYARAIMAIFSTWN